MSNLELTISLNVLEHLGIGLYSNVPAVIAEMVANAWDADASEVHIRIDREGDEITVWDDGRGMTRDEVNEKFLRVGYSRRDDEGDTTPGGRPVMGRKGIGKLSTFAIARCVEVHTARCDATDDQLEKTAFVMDRKDIREEVEDEESDGTATYEPDEKTPASSYVEFDKGTRLKLSHLDKRLVRTSEHVRRRVARRFSIIGHEHGFDVYVDGKAVTAADRDYFGKLQFVWSLGRDGMPSLRERIGRDSDLLWVRSNVYVSEDEELAKKVERDEIPQYRIDVTEESEDPCRYPTKLSVRPPEGADETSKVVERYAVEGWLGTARKPSQLEEDDTKVSVFARGKLAQEDIASGVAEARYFKSYLVGEIYADFLDEGEEDVITSDRQSIKKSHPKYLGLRRYTKRALNQVALEWDELRKEKAVESALDFEPVRDWFRRLPDSQQPYAKDLLRRIESLKVRDEQTRRELFRSSLLAFEKLALQDSLDKIRHLEGEGAFEALRALFDSLDEFEAAQLYQIVRGRLRVVSELSGVEDAAEKAKIIGRYVPDHLWMVDATWQEIVEPDYESEAQALLQDEYAKLSVRRKKQVIYRRLPGRHLIVDLRKYGSVLSPGNLLDSSTVLTKALERFVALLPPSERGGVEVLCIVGEVRGRGGRALGEENIIAREYDTLVERAQKEYKEYLAKRTDRYSLIQLIRDLGPEEEVEAPREVTELTADATDDV